MIDALATSRRSVFVAPPDTHQGGRGPTRYPARVVFDLPVAHASGENHVPHYRRILLAVDLTPESVLVGHRAREVAAALGAELAILHALEPLPLSAPVPPEPVAASLVAGQAELMEIARERISALARELGVPKERTQVVLGISRGKSSAPLSIKRRISSYSAVTSDTVWGSSLRLPRTSSSTMPRATCLRCASRITDTANAAAASVPPDPTGRRR
jgi:Universal stress protein family